MKKISETKHKIINLSGTNKNIKDQNKKFYFYQK